MEMQEERTVIVCMRVCDLPVPHVPGSTRERCRRCGLDVWISPATRRAWAHMVAVEGEEVEIACLECVLLELNLPEEEKQRIREMTRERKG